MRSIALALFLSVITFAGISAAPLLQSDSPVRIVYFYSSDCPHCQAVQQDVLAPLQTTYGSRLDIRMFEIRTAAYYELLIRAEEQWKIAAEQRGIPTLVIGEKFLIGEEEIRAQLPGLVERGLAQGGTNWPAIPGLAVVLQAAANAAADPSAGDPSCQQTIVSCSAAAPIWVAYFYQVGCQECSRAKLDLDYVRARYPQIIVQEFNIYSETPLGEWLADRIGRKDWHTPAVFVGSDALIGEAEINPNNLQALAEKYTAQGTDKIWEKYDPTGAQSGLMAQFRAMGPLTVIAAGLIDGLNPCAFATLIFLVSYLTFSGRKGREVVAVGATFTFGVFLAYLGVGLGLYKILDLLGGWLTLLSRWVYAITALLCVILAVLSFRDFLQARQGRLQDMSLKLPPFLRNRVNAMVRTGQRARAFVAGAFITGVVVSLIELACTGQIYLPTIIFVTSIPELRVQGIGYLVLYNLMFILPLVVVFGLVYFGTTSFQLGRFLERNTARVKLGAVLLFAALATWLGLSLLL